MPEEPLFQTVKRHAAAAITRPRKLFRTTKQRINFLLPFCDKICVLRTDFGWRLARLSLEEPTTVIGNARIAPSNILIQPEPHIKHI